MNAPSPKPICDTDPSRRGGIDLNAVTQAEFRNKAREQRSYSIEFKRDLHRGSELRWQMRPYGPGHWCRCDGQPHWFRTEAEARDAGEHWVAKGRTS